MADFNNMQALDTGGGSSFANNSGQVTQQDIPTSMHREYHNGAGKTVTIFSTTDDPQTDQVFNQAMDQYGKDKSVPDGFKIVTDPVLAKIRAIFEAGAQPIRQAAKGFSGAVDEVTGYDKVANKLYNPNEPNPVTNLQFLAHAAGTAPQLLTSQYTSPEALGGNIGLGTAVALTSKLNLPLQMAAAGLGSLVGELFGKGVTGGDMSKVGDAAMNAVAAATMHGALGVIKGGLGYGLSKQAQEGVDQGLVDMVAKKYPGLRDNPHALPSVLNTKAGISDAVQLGVKGLRGDIDVASESILSNLESKIPKSGGGAFSFPVKVRNELKGYVNSITAQQNKMLDNIGDKDVLDVGKEKITELQNKIRETVKDEFLNIVGKGGAAGNTLAGMQADKATNLLLLYGKEADKFMDGAQVYAALKRAGADGEFNVGKFQQEIKSYYRNPAYGSLMQEAGNIAGRGGPGINMPGGRDYMRDVSGHSATDKAANIVGGTPGLVMQLLSKLHPQTYAGSIPYNRPFPNAAATITGVDAMKSFLTPSKKE